MPDQYAHQPPQEDKIASPVDGHLTPDIKEPITADQYAYQPLRPGEIRLVELHPSPEGQRRIRRVEHVSLAEAPAFTAISYVWGDPSLTQTVYCDEPNSYVKITKNLKLALSSRAREASNPQSSPGANQRILVWADGICINQRDIKERNEQVKIMSDIYQKAEGVHIWLGDGDEHSPKAFKLIQMLRRKSDSHPASEHQYSLTYTPDLRERPKFFGLRPTWDNVIFIEKATVAFIDLLERPWFQRVWIVQELAVSRNARLHCGESSVDWDTLVRAVRYSMAVRLRPIEDAGRLKVLKLAETHESRQRPADADGPGSQGEVLQRLLFRHHDWSSTDPVDMIYALRGLSLNAGPDDLNVEVDYGIQTETSYIRLAYNILRRDGNLDILAACQQVPNSTSSLLLPSWVPDWSTTGKHTPLNHQGYTHFAAAGNFTHCTPQFFDDDATAQEPDKKGLLLDGFLLDKVSALSPPPALGVLPEHTASLISDFYTLYYEKHFTYAKIEKMFSLRSRKATYFTGESMMDVYWQTTIAGCMQPEGYDTLRQFFLDPEKMGNWRPVKVRFWLPPKWLFITFHAIWVLWVLLKSILMGLLGCFVCLVRCVTCGICGCVWDCLLSGAVAVLKEPERATVDTLAAEKLVYMRSGDWTFAKTQTGYMGLLPSSTLPGDSIFLFEGGKVPFVLRQFSDDSWRMVGACYVHGVMQGSAFSEEKCKEVKIY